MGGIVSVVRKHNTKGGSVMAFITVEDLYGSIDCIAFPRVYDKIKSLIRPDTVVTVTGKLDIQPEKLPVIRLDTLKEFVPPENKRAEETPVQTEKILWLDARSLAREDFDELIEMMEGYAGNVKTKILYEGKRYEYAVNLSKAFTAELRTFLSAEQIKLVER